MTCVEDLRRRTHGRVPKMFYDYVASGSWTEGTLRENERSFADIRLRQRILVDIEKRSVESTMIGEKVSMPVALSPCGFGGMMWPNGEAHAARAAEKFGVPFALSTMSILSVEQVREATTKPFWFQLYVMRDRDFVARLIQRAKDAQCSALILTLDLQVLGQRHADVKNGLSAPPRPTLQSLLDLGTKPEWCLRMLGAKSLSFGNIVGHAKGVDNMSSLSAWTQEQFDPRLSWADVEWIKKQWGGKLILKGIMDVQDARIAVQSGADAIIVSNHGGRQLDGAPAAVEVLPEIVAAVGDKIEVWIDGGIRSGQSVLKALALGAKGTMIGRPWLYGLGAYGEDGVRLCLEMVHKELDLTMAFCGKTSIDQVDKGILYEPYPHRPPPP